MYITHKYKIYLVHITHGDMLSQSSRMIKIKSQIKYLLLYNITKEVLQLSCHKKIVYSMMIAMYNTDRLIFKQMLSKL